MEDLYLFHYIFDPSPEVIDSILKNGLLPVDKLESTRWIERHSKKGKDYFRETYKKLYQKVLGGRKYVHYGIYLTPINLWGLGLKLKGRKVDRLPRVEIPLKEINLRDCVLSERLKRRIRRVPTKRVIKNSIRRWTKEETIKAWNTSRWPFVKIPQVVCFSKKPIPVTSGMIKYFKG